jgi:hypothetical protein
MSYWARLVVGLGLIVASATMFVYSLVELVTHIHGSCGSGTDTDTGVTLSPCPHNTAFWIIALVVSVFIFIAGVIGYVGRGSPPARTREADVSSSGLPGLGPVSMAPMAAAPAPTPAAVAASNVADQIQQLQQLKDGGLLDDDEFKKARAKILGGRP